MFGAWLLWVYLHTEGLREDKFTEAGLKRIRLAELEGMIDIYDVWIMSSIVPSVVSSVGRFESGDDVRLWFCQGLI